MNKNYDDIIGLERPISSKHTRMSRYDRAAQFSPFAALVGYDAEVSETARLTNEKIDLDEGEKAEINRRLLILQQHQTACPQIEVTYFVSDEKKSGGKYVTKKACVKKIDIYKKIIVMCDSTGIPFDDITALYGEIFD